MRIQQHKADQMTPLERRQAVREGRDYDRIPCVPFMGEFKCSLTGTSVWDFWHDPQKMADTEIAAFNRYGYDRIVIGPNTRGITEAMGGKFIYPEKGVPYADTPLIQDYAGLEDMEIITCGFDGMGEEKWCAEWYFYQQKDGMFIYDETGFISAKNKNY